MTEWYVTFYACRWGRGNTPRQAKRNAKGRGRAWYTVKLPEGAEEPRVDDMGRIHWDGPEYDCTVPLPVVACGSQAPTEVKVRHRHWKDAQ